MKRPLTIRVRDDFEDGLPRVQFRAGNHQIMLSSEGYQGGPDKAKHSVAVIVAAIREGNYRLEFDYQPPTKRRWRRRA